MFPLLCIFSYAGIDCYKLPSYGSFAVSQEFPFSFISIFLTSYLVFHLIHWLFQDKDNFKYLCSLPCLSCYSVSSYISLLSGKILYIIFIPLIFSDLFCDLWYDALWRMTHVVLMRLWFVQLLDVKFCTCLLDQIDLGYRLVLCWFFCVDYLFISDTAVLSSTSIIVSLFSYSAPMLDEYIYLYTLLHLAWLNLFSIM